MHWRIFFFFARPRRLPAVRAPGAPSSFTWSATISFSRESKSLRRAMARSYHGHSLEGSRNQPHRPAQAAERVGGQGEARQPLVVREQPLELRAGEIGLLEHPLRLEQEGLDPAHGEGALAQVVAEEEDQVAQVVAALESRA